MKRFSISVHRLMIILLTLTMLCPNNVALAYGKKLNGEYRIQTSMHSGYFTSSAAPKSILKHIEKGEWGNINYPIPPTDTYLYMNNGSIFAIDHQLNIYDIKSKKLLVQVPGKINKQLSKDMKKLRTNHYGEILLWKDANEILPRYSKFTVLDLDSGSSFNVQRRAGSYHADVQPLTKKDTDKMKEIYHGSWSWDRKAILILTEDKKFAASMHGMPHGQGAIRNGFPGHFCIHFQDSITHKSKKMDHAHSIMIKKASGEWLDHTQKLTPTEIVDATIIAIHQHDWFILSSILDDKNRILLEKEAQKLEEIHVIKRLSDLPENEKFNTELSVQLPIELYIDKNTGTVKKDVLFTIERPSIEEPWTIDLEKLIEQF
ncbi:hypothetical protein [Sutcliffiella deserti]|uniref:hypothetical protein n=1 Tax=Sutcliffiella deserti TaxID=2875501 RepID=UPI001CBC766E|nr:hypothetical protein [Sutcliffiella deserti]